MNAPDSPAPTLGSALWLYLIALFGTAVIVIGLQGAIRSVSFLRLIATFLAVGLPLFIAVLAFRLPIGSSFGKRPRLWHVIAALFIGAAAWLPASWLTFVANYALDAAIGILPPPPAVTEGALPLAAIIQLGIVVPTLQGTLFWAYLQRSAAGLGANGAALFAAVLYGLFALTSTEFGYAGIAGALLIGLLAAFATRYGESAWCGIAVGIGYSLVRPLIENTPLEARLFTALGTDLFGGAWLLTAGTGLFVAIVLLQMVRAFRAAPPESPPRVRLGKAWQVPLIIALALCLLIGYGEFGLRARNSVRSLPSLPDDGSTSVPIRPTGTP
ncbi:MAG: hypothetical protein CUN49_09705 [Candidatus Thermofonsia Clade 1 bacterium]|jgi:hypothetical protein|uniref:CPBP family intramembrane metalloprotease domain-containing protein n=1 Tax=Candidatus Thermofonsia Clade 1 bacterium TaxID=2364210 RepID=A0A2M8PDJ9_9CHLR|nr:MAG: hypothetical protein CUN49_09705 [Candidatus Thermofonsia Clade 1 bacterium]RMF49947.1 MAG: hypothetical protein D6749_11890 [Chloroflexota bacterium]